MTPLSRLTATELAGLSRGIGDVHLAVSRRVFRALGPPALPVQLMHDAIARADLRGGERWPVGRRPDAAAGRRRPLVLGALNGLIGDELHAQGSPLAIPMAAERIGEPRTPDVVVFVHGLGETELAWGAEPYGDRLPGWTPVYVRYNTGRSIAEHAAELGALIEALDWDVERIALVGHSMGGLVARSACARGGDWTARVSHTISLGTPHDGAPLEQLVHGLSAVLERAPERGRSPASSAGAAPASAICAAVCATRCWTARATASSPRRSPPPTPTSSAGSSATRSCCRRARAARATCSTSAARTTWRFCAIPTCMTSFSAGFLSSAKRRAPLRRRLRPFDLTFGHNFALSTTTPFREGKAAGEGQVGARPGRSSRA